jgi:uncharacterized membrane protein
MSSRFMTHIKARGVPLAIWSGCVVLVVVGAALFDWLAMPEAWLALKYGGGLALVLSIFPIWTRKPRAQLREERRERAKGRLMQMRVRRGTSMHEADLERLQVQGRGFIATCWHTSSLRVGIVAIVTVAAMCGLLVLGQDLFRLLPRDLYELCMAVLLGLGVVCVFVLLYGVIRCLSTWSANGAHRETWRTMQTLREERFQGVTPGELSIASAPTDGGLTEHEEGP